MSRPKKSQHKRATRQMRARLVLTLRRPCPNCGRAEPDDRWRAVAEGTEVHLDCVCGRRALTIPFMTDRQAASFAKQMMAA